MTPLAGTGARYVFGSYLAPSLAARRRHDRADADQGRRPGADRRRAAAVRRGRCRPVRRPPAASRSSVYGHGFTRSAADVFLASVANAQAGLATIATDVVGHGYGERSTWQITSGGPR